MGLRFDVEVSLALGADITADPGTWAWTDITAYAEGEVEIHHGRVDYQTQVQASWCILRLNNGDGRFTRLNPTGAYYGQLRKNTPIRIRACATGGSLVTRFVGFVSEWPPRWTPGQLYEWVPVRADGVLRRLGQGSAPRSALRRWYDTSSPLAYWALDGGELSTIGSLTAGAGGVFVPSSIGQFPSSEWGLQELASWLGSGLTFQTASSSGSALATVTTTASTTRLTLDLTYAWDTFGAASSLLHMSVREKPESTGTDNPRWTVEIEYDGSTYEVQVGAVSGGGVIVNSPTTVAATGDPGVHHLRLDLVQNGGNIDWAVYLDGTSVHSGSVADTIDAYSYVRLAKAQEGSVVFGHAALFVGATPPSVTDAADAAQGWAGETDVDRFNRFCTEAAVPHVTASGDGITLGPQPTADDVTTLRDVEAAGQGVLHEALTGALAYHPLSARYNLAVALELDHDQGHIVPEFQPADDDRLTRNDVTVTRTNGASSAPAMDEDSVAAIGRYDDAKTLNLYSDLQVGDHAGWLLWMGTSTAGEYRYPVVELALHKSSSLVTAWLACGVGSRMTIDNMPAGMPPDLIDLIIEGWTERVGSAAASISINAGSYKPWREIGEWVDGASPGTDPDRYAAVGSTLYAAIDDNDTSLSVVPGTRRWTTTAGDMNPDMQIRVAPVEGLLGEVMEISAVANAPSFVAAGTAASAVNAAVSPGAPAGKAVGDCLLLFAGVSDAALTPPTITGWTLIGTGLTKCGFYVRTADGTATDTPTVTFAGTGAGDTVIAQIAAFRGVAVPTSIDDLAGDTGIQSNSSAQNIASPALTVTQDLGVAILFAFKNDDWTSVAAASGYTEIGEPDLATGDDFGLWWGYQIQTAATNIATGTITVTGGASATSASRVYALRGLQTLTVSARSVNGAVMSHAAGSAIQLARVARYSIPAESSGSVITAGQALVSPTAPSLGPLAGAFLDELYPYAAADLLIPPRGFTSDGSSGNYASTPDTSALDITGDITLEAEVSPDDWTPAAFDVVLGKYVGSTNNRSYYLGISTGGAIVIGWSTLGTGVTEVTRSSTATISLGTGERLAIKATLDVNNGAAGHTARFYTADSIDGPWTQLGADVVTAGTTSIFASTAVLSVGGVDAGTTAPFAGIVHIARVRNGIDGSIAANVRFMDEIPGTTSFVDETSLTWTINGTAVIS